MSNNSDSEIFFEIEELEETEDMETAEINHPASNTSYYCESCEMNFYCLDEHIQKLHKNQTITVETEDACEKNTVLLETMDSDTVLDAAKEPVESISMDSIEELEPPVISTKRTSTRKTRLVIKEEFEIDTSTEDNFKPESKIRLKSEQNPPSNLQSTGFLCSVCQTSFKTQKQYKLHLKIHRNYENLEIEKEKNTQFIDALNLNCKTCNKSFNDPMLFEMHLNTHDENPYVPKKGNLKILDSELTKKGKYACKFCGKEFVRAHEKVKHEMVHSGEKPFSCKICGKSFRVSYCLSLHKRTHSDERPYVCSFPSCDKRFKSQSVYNHHIKIHSNLKGYQCPYCPKAFNTSVQLSGHKNSHTKPFSCTICSRKFATMYAVKLHMESHKKKDSKSSKKGKALNHTCEICGASYGRDCALRDHMAETHPEIIETDEKIVVVKGTAYEIVSTSTDNGVETFTVQQC